MTALASLRLSRIKDALAVVHHNEANQGRALAASAASKLLALSEAERAVLYNALDLPENQL